MWSGGTKRRPAAYWLSQRCVARRLAGGALDLVATESVDQGLDQLKDWLAKSSGRNGQLWLGGALCQLVTVPAMKGVSALQEAEAVAKLEQQAKGALLEGFDFKLHECSPDAAQWRATLTDRRLMGAEVNLWQRKLASMKPWWSWALAQGSTEGAGRPRIVLASDGETLTELIRDGEGRVTLGQTQGVPGGQDAQRRQLLRRQAVAGDAMLTGVSMNFEAERNIDSSARSDQTFPFAPWVEVHP